MALIGSSLTDGDAANGEKFDALIGGAGWLIGSSLADGDGANDDILNALIGGASRVVGWQRRNEKQVRSSIIVYYS